MVTGRRIVKLSPTVLVELDESGLPASTVHAEVVTAEGARLAWNLLYGAAVVGVAPGRSGPEEVALRFAQFMQSTSDLQASGQVALAALQELLREVLCPMAAEGLLPSVWVQEMARERGAL